MGNLFSCGRLFASVLMLTVMAACSDAPPPPPPVEVVVQQVEVRPYQANSSFVGNLRAEEDVKIQAKVSGYLKARHFQEGDLVEAGALLYELDRQPFEAELARARAALSKAEAASKVAAANYERAKELLQKSYISRAEFDKLEGTMLQAEADLESARAELRTAELNLAYTRITAPISGRIGSSEISAGDLVGPERGTLTTLVNVDPIRAAFQVSEEVFLAAMERRRQQAASGETVPDVEVRIQLASGDIYPHVGRMNFVSNRLDPTTGTIEVFASIPNPDGILRPGQYVKVLLQNPVPVQAVFTPQVAVQADQAGAFVLTVGPDNTVERRNVTLGDRVDDEVVVREGLQGSERVIVRGLQKVRPGQQVTTRQLSTAAQDSPPDTPGA